MCQYLKKVLERAIPGADTEIGDRLLIDQFLLGQPISRQLRVTEETTGLAVVLD